MALFNSAENPVRYGVILEIASGSVLAAIVRSERDTPHPDIIWSMREYAKRTTEQDLSISAKGVLTALINVTLATESAGRAALKTYDKTASLKYVQVSITAPWSYTISKVINYTETGTFTITTALITSLMEAAQKKIVEELKENEVASDLGLVIMTRATTDIQANEYRTLDPVGQKAETLTLTQVSGVAQTYITDAINEIHKKVLPHTAIERYSFMLLFHCVIRELHHNTTEYCLVDITDEATEIGIVRDGILRYCTHTPLGISSIARELATVLSLPIDEAHAFLREPYYSHALGEMKAENRAKVEAILTEYQSAVTDLFHETGDTLSIPKVLFLHGGFQTETFFTEQIALAARAATNSTHNIHPVSTELLTEHYTAEQKQAIMEGNPDTAILVAAAFFHKQHHCNDFIQV